MFNWIRGRKEWKGKQLVKGRGGDKGMEEGQDKGREEGQDKGREG